MSGHHKVVVVQSKGISGDDAVHANVRILPYGTDVKYGEFDLTETAKIIEIESSVKCQYVAAAVKKITMASENIAPDGAPSSYVFEPDKYPILIQSITENVKKIEAIKDTLDLDDF